MSTSSTVVLILAVFAASTVEMVEALTIVVAAGVTRSWRSALEGAAAAAVVLAIIVLVVGVPLIHYVPINALRVIVGAMLLVLGLSWLRKSILRASGHKALHDEDAIFAATSAELVAPESSSIISHTPRRSRVRRGLQRRLPGRDGGRTHRRQPRCQSAPIGNRRRGGRRGGPSLSSLGALVAKQLSQVPENTIKLAVGIMLTSFGLFWVGEGTGAHWPGSDAAIIVLIGLFFLVTMGSIAWLRSLQPTARYRPSDTSVPEPVEE